MYYKSTKLKNSKVGYKIFINNMYSSKSIVPYTYNTDIFITILNVSEFKTLLLCECRFHKEKI